MSTRALIKVEGLNIALYKHYDGYPDGILPWLEDFYKTFFSKRKDDSSYCLAQLIRSTTNPRYKLVPSDITGYGIVMATDDCGQEYEYTLTAKGTIEVKEL